MLIHAFVCTLTLPVCEAISKCHVTVQYGNWGAIRGRTHAWTQARTRSPLSIIRCVILVASLRRGGGVSDATFIPSEDRALERNRFGAAHALRSTFSCSPQALIRRCGQLVHIPQQRVTVSMCEETRVRRFFHEDTYAIDASLSAPTEKLRF